MSWVRGYSKPDTSESREERRRKLEEDRQSRARKRQQLQNQLAAAQQSRQEADQALQDFLDIDPDIFEESELVEEASEDLLDIQEIEMVDFDQENAEDSATAMDNLRSVQCPFNKGDIEFWFSQLEDQLTLIGVKKQWTKKIALVRFLPPEIQNQVKSLLKLGQTAAGTDIYFRIKKQLLKMYGPKPEDGYLRAKNRVLTETPSQLGKQIVEDICPGEIKLQGCHCANTVWGIFREAIPIIIRNHIADMAFNADTYEAVFDKADQVWNSNKGSEPLPSKQVAAVSRNGSPEVAAVQKGQNSQKNKNQNGQRGQGQGQGGQRGQGNQNQGGQNQKNGQNQNNQARPTKPALNEDKLCRIHAKWKDNATFCAAPWGCRMKDVYRAPQ